MGRPRNPRGKDRTRTIQLDGDLTEIAQKLADKHQLSSTLSELLRREFGAVGEIDQLKQQLTVTIEERQALQAAEENLIAKIDLAEAEQVQRRTSLIPQLQNQRKILADRHARLVRELSRCITAYEEKLKQRQIDNVKDRLNDVDRELEALS